MFRGVLKAGCVAVALVLGCGGAPIHGQDGSDDAHLPLLERIQETTTRDLSTPESDLAQKNGFVIVPSSRVPSFHFGYSALFEADQPVYISADAILHAVHASFSDILKEMELSTLTGELGILVDELRGAVSRASDHEARADVDTFLAVTKSLLDGKPAAPVAGGDRARIDALVAAATAAAGPQRVTLFGAPLELDFSMMKPRGHYTSDPRLTRYFRAMSWLGRMELRLAEDPGTGEMALNRGALAAALLISDAMSPRAKTAWRRIDTALELLIGQRDAMGLPSFTDAMKRAGVEMATVSTAEEKPVLDVLLPISEQRINTQLLTPFHKTIPLWVVGQRYVADAEVLSATSYGKLPEKRMMPSTLDVAAAVFKNPAAHALLADDYAAFPTLRPAVDRVSTTVKALGPEVWERSMSHVWMHALGALTTGDRAGLPEVMTTDAWNRRLLNTQLASWAERRHDTILYAKQSVTAIAGCSFPEAYVDPYPALYERLRKLAELGSTAVTKIGMRGPRAKRMTDYFARLSELLETLRAIAVRERAGQPMREAHLEFINRAVSVHGRQEGSGWDVVYTIGGWLADLYFIQENAKFHKPTIADVHTQPTDAIGNPVGKVLHVATGHPQLIEVRIGERRFRGFVSSYHEVITKDFERHDDAWMRKHEKELSNVPWLPAPNVAD